MPCLVLKSAAPSWKLCFCVQFLQIVFWFLASSMPLLLVDAFLTGLGDPAEVGFKVAGSLLLCCVVLCQGMYNLYIGCMW